VETLTFLFTDIEGSTALLRRLGEGDYGRVLADHQALIRAAVLGLGCLAADLGDWDRSAVLHGVAQAFLDRSGEPWQDVEARYQQHNLA